MLSLKNIASYYPKQLQTFPRYMLREYLQCKILEIIFNSPLAPKLSFIGGTALRIVHENTRFPEDLDFEKLAKDVTPFVFNSAGGQRVEMFRKYIEEKF